MSEIRANIVSNAAGTGPATLTGQVSLKSVINCNNDTTTIRESFNISSVTDHGTGLFSFSFTNSFSTNDWSFSFGGGDDTGNGNAVMNIYNGAAPKTTSGMGVETNNNSFVAADRQNNCVHVYGDLA